MRKMCHLSFSSHEEVMFRSVEDINYAFNCFALAGLKTESRLLADSEMTTHVHFGACTDCPKELFVQFRYPYSRYFNSKYGRSGRLGERAPFILETDGLYHSQTMLSYVYRQGLHHGLSATAFGYNHSSVNAIFQSELGRNITEEFLPRTHWYKYLPNTSGVPDNYRMNKSGLLLREDVIDTGYVEELYVSPRNFLYQMNRLSSDKWSEEQIQDENKLPPITLSSVEPPYYSPSLPQLMKNETTRTFRQDISDLELCHIIDTYYLSRMLKSSIYLLPLNKRKELGNKIVLDFRRGEISRLLGRNAGLPDSRQISRCLALCHE